MVKISGEIRDWLEVLFQAAIEADAGDDTLALSTSASAFPWASAVA